MSVPAFSPVIEDPQLTKAVSDLEQVRGGWAEELTKLDKYMRGQQEISYMSDAMRKEFGDAITDLVLNFPELVVEAHGDRLDVEGFRFPGETSGNDALWGVWQANNMDERSVMGHTDALGLTKAAVIVGAGDDTDLPVITVESAMDCSWIRSPATGAVTSALKRWAESDGSQWASLYVLGTTRTVTLDRGTWRVTRKDDHGLDRVPLVPLINRPRIKYRDGRSEFASVIPIADAANKMATDMMVSGEYHAMPRRWVFGLKRSDFVGSDGSPKAAWSSIKGRLWANENADVKVGQFPESDLRNFHDTIKLLARLVAQMAALPIDYLAFDSVNPPSADALRAAESRLVKRVERRQTSFGDSWEEVMRLVMLFQRGSLEPNAARLETVWREASTPTVSQKADATVKLYSAGIIPREQAWVDMGYSPVQRADMAGMFASETSTDPIVAATRNLAAGTGNAPAGG